MEQLNWHIAAELSKHFQVRVIAPCGAAQHTPDRATILEIPLEPLPRFLLDAALRARSEARAWRPDIVLAGSGLTAPLAWSAARAGHARAMVYVHGLDLTVPHPVYRVLWHPALRRMDRIIANSCASAKLALNLGIPPERIAVVNPGVDTFAPDPEARSRFRTAFGIAPRVPVLLFVGRLTTRKGLREFVRDVLPRIAQHFPDVQLLVVGEAPRHALYARPQSPQLIQSAAEASGVGKNLRMLGTLFGKALSDAYAGADVHVFPVRQLPDDPEGFGMVAIEAAAHGLPTVAYATGGVIEAVAQGKSGILVEPNDHVAFAEAVLRILRKPLPRAGILRFAEKFAWPKFRARLLEAIDVS